MSDICSRLQLYIILCFFIVLRLQISSNYKQKSKSGWYICFNPFITIIQKIKRTVWVKIEKGLLIILIHQFLKSNDYPKIYMLIKLFQKPYKIMHHKKLINFSSIKIELLKFFFTGDCLVGFRFYYYILVRIDR